MLLTKQEFQEKLENKTLKIAFIGMSNTGKSFRSDELHNIEDFNYIHVDDEIEKDLNLSSMAEMAAWMGYPFDERYERRSKRYLKLEDQHTKNTEYIKCKNNFVLDTTGSVIHLPQETLTYLSENYLLILLDIEQDQLEHMKKLYFKEPKSVYWGESFSQKDSEDTVDALKRCYPKLLEDRKQKYRDLADIIIPGEISQYKGLSIHRFLEIISFSLPNQK